jgi:transcriptional regulator with XRE-family HTH domain
MARLNLTMDQVIEATGLSERTVKEILRGHTKPHARTLHRLAAGLDISADEFFLPCPAAVDSRPRSINCEVRKKVAALLNSEQRNLLIELVDALARCSTESLARESKVAR